MQKVAWTLSLIKEIDIVPEQYLKKLERTNGIWEIRSKSGGTQIRILAFWQKSNLIILTGGFIKKSKKTPPKEIEKAEKRMLDYLNRHEQ